MKSFLYLIFPLLLLPGLAFSADEVVDTSVDSSVDLGPSAYRLSLDSRDSRLTFGFYGQISQFSREGESLMAYAAEVQASYGLLEKVAVQLSLEQAISSEGGLTIAYTGMRSALSYAYLGEYIKKDSVLKVNERPTLTFHSGDVPLLAVDAGLDQFFFNGTSRIVPATGASVGGRYDRTLYGFRASFTARYGMLVISEITVPMMTVGAGLLFSF